MSSNGWYSKQDVMKDLVEVTGKCYDDIGENYVVGENPPPAWKGDEDNEDLLRFYGGQKPMQCDKMEKPDLVGITQMLRMVDNYYETSNGCSTSNEEHVKSKTTKIEPANIIVSISKLNPNVNVFVPIKTVDSIIDTESKVSKNELNVIKGVSLSNYETSNGCSTSNEEHVKSKTTKKAEPAIIIGSISKLNPNVNVFVPQKSVDSSIDIESKVRKKELNVIKGVSLSNLVGAKETVKTDCCGTKKNNISDNSELKEMREQLRTKICDTSKVKCVKMKRERNLAIATLLKLYCQQPAKDHHHHTANHSKPPDEKKPNLICPDYFKNNPAYINETRQTEQSVSKSNSDNIFAENNLNASSEADIIKKEIAASVEKVTRWLHNSEPEKISEQHDGDIKEPTSNITEIAIPIKKTIIGPLIHLGPVTFKRKTNNNHPISPVSLQSDNSKTKSETYVPSVYASELTKKYIQQSKTKQEAQTGIWKNLETQLKEKDEAIKKQRMQTLT